MNDVKATASPAPGRLRAWFTRTIARKLLGAFLLVFVVTYLATAAVVLTGVRTAVTRAELDALSQLAHRKLDNLNAAFAHLATDLHAWSKLDVMNDLASGDVDKRVERTLEDLKKEYDLKGELYAFNAAGKLIASSKRTPEGTTLPPNWRPHDRLTFVDKHADPLGKGDIVVLSVPVMSAFSAHYRLGTLVLTVPWNQVASRLSGMMVLLRERPYPVMLASTLPGSLDNGAVTDLIRQRGWMNIGGTRYLVNNAHQRRGLIADWQVAVLHTPKSVNHTLGTVALQLAALLFLLALPLTAGILWLSQRLTAPLRELTAFVARITRTGDLSQRFSARAQDELGTLAHAFNDMTARLQEAAQERERFVMELEQFAENLELKVQDRTQKLSAANEELTRTLSDLKAAQGQLIHQEKMASLGQLVAGVAHELNNPIGFIYANFPHLEEYVRTLLELLDELKRLPLPAESAARMEALTAEADLEFLRKDILKIIRSGQSGASRVKEIISSLRSFSRLDEALIKRVRLEEGLDDTLAILQHHIKNRIEVVRDYRLKDAVLCHPGQLNQVFMNLIYNAIQAISGSGTITVSTSREEDRAVVAISDTGAGIAPEALGHIFDPFFTTKEVGEGTGLGLSISYGIVEKHGGNIDVQSEVGRGTTFTIRIPMNNPTIDTEREETP